MDPKDRSVWDFTQSMPNTRGIPTGKQSLLPPKSPGSMLPPSYVDYNSGQCMGTIGFRRPREGYRHQRTSSESIIEEQPSWLDDLLNEPETPARKGSHRRSSSDSFAYVDMSNLSSNLDNLAHDNFNYRNITSQSSWGPEDFDRINGLKQPHYVEATSFRRPQNRKQELTLNTPNYPGSGHPSAKNKNIIHSGPISTTKEPEALTSIEQDQHESAQDAKGSSDKIEESHPKQPQPELESKRVKQQFAQRSRVRKLQYIAELESNVQSLQAEGLEISAEIEFLSQQNLILSLENKALKQRFDSLSQEHLIKCYEHDMLERERARIGVFLHHQHQQLQPLPPRKHSQQQKPQQNPTSSNHGRNYSRDLDLQFATLSVNHKDATFRESSSKHGS